MKKLLILIGLIILITGCKTTEERHKLKSQRYTEHSSTDDYIVTYANPWRYGSKPHDNQLILAANHCKKFDKFAFLYLGKTTFTGGTVPSGVFYYEDGNPYSGVPLDKFHCFSEQQTWRNAEELGTGGDPAGELYVIWTNYDHKLATKRKKETEEKENLIKAQKAEKEKINKQINTCSSYGFEQGSEPFRQCINDLMQLELEYAKLHNEQLLLEAQIEQAKANKQSNLLSELQLQSLIAQQNQALEIQNFNSGMNSLLLGLELMTPSQPTTTGIICNHFGTMTQCY